MHCLKFQCFVCSESFKSGQLLKAHIEHHDFTKAFKCGFCNDSFHEISMMIAHINRIHDGLPILYRCGICKVTFELMIDLENHVSDCQESLGFAIVQEKNQNCAQNSGENPLAEISNTNLEMKVDDDQKHPDMLSGNNVKEEPNDNHDASDVYSDNSSEMKLDEDRDFSERCNDSNLDIKLEDNQECSDHCREPSLSEGAQPNNFLYQNTTTEISDTACQQNLDLPQPAGSEPIFLQSSSASLRKMIANDSKSPLSCRICFKIFFEEKELDKHITSHTIHESYSIQCVKCNAMFNDLEGINLHLDDSECTGFFCSKCQIGFALEAHLLRHNVHFHKKGTTEMECGECGKKFSTYGAWARHEAYHVKHKQFCCKLCDKTFAQADPLEKYHLPKVHGVTSKLRRNIRTNTAGNNRFTSAYNQKETTTGVESTPDSLCCKVCGQTYITVEELQKHVSSHVIEDCFHVQCFECKTYFQDEAWLQKHLRDSECSGFACSSCNDSFSLQYSLFTHIVQVHRNRETDMKCEKCGHISQDLSALMRHEGSHAVCQYECKLCNKRVRTKRSFYDLHMKQVHNIKKKKFHGSLSEEFSKAVGHQVSINCELCGGKVGDTETLAKHKSYHFMEGKFSIQCSGCHLIFYRLDDLMNHVQEELCSQYYCNECNKYFMTQSDFVLHNAEKHKTSLDSGLLKCFVCAQVFENSSGYVDHALENHVTSQPFHCMVCNSNFKTEERLKFHLNKVHTIIESKKNPTFTCSKCLAKFGTKRALEIHKCFHRGSKFVTVIKDTTDTLDFDSASYLTPFVCKICFVGFGRALDLDEHKQLHSSQTLEKSECPTCKKVVLSKYLKDHMAGHSATLLCTYCGKYINARKLTNHIRVFHSEDKPYQCNICHKTLSCANRLETHMWLHTGYKPYECKICGKKFTLPNLLESHMNTHSTKNFKCHLCSYKCRHQTQLKIHIDKHNNIKRYKCSVCGKSFRTSSGRNTHQERHLGGHKCSCTFCGKKFDKNYIKSHMRTHTKVKPHACPKCDASFTMRSNLNSHIKKVHGNQVFKQFQEECRLKRDQDQAE